MAKMINNTKNKLLVKMSNGEFNWIKQGQIIDLSNPVTGKVSYINGALNAGMSHYTPVAKVEKAVKEVLKVKTKKVSPKKKKE
ncbi:MAG TPA: hypothetical protein ENK70_07985 [Methylophaga sp.]|nr:hypothetical protein [Methylophaga sp.]